MADRNVVSPGTRNPFDVDTEQRKQHEAETPTEPSKPAPSPPRGREPVHAGKGYDEIVNEAETGNSSSIPSHAGVQAQSTDSFNKY